MIGDMRQEYKIAVGSSAYELQTAVNRELADGWRASGGVACHVVNAITVGWFYMQTPGRTPCSDFLRE